MVRAASKLAAKRGRLLKTVNPSVQLNTLKYLNTAYFCVASCCCECGLCSYSCSAQYQTSHAAETGEEELKFVFNVIIVERKKVKIVC